jgi:AcrR family transcriptional regulator
VPKIVDVAERRTRLSNAVMAILERDGHRAVTIRSVAAELGTSTSGVTHYVASREELVAAAVTREGERWIARLSAGTESLRGGDRVRALLASAVLESTSRERRAWIAIATSAVHDPVVAAALAPFNAWWDAALHDAVTSCGLRGGQHADAVNALDVLATGLVFSRSTEADAWPRARARREVDRLVNLVLSV